MEKLLDIAIKKCNKVEIYSLNHTIDVAIFENAKLKDIHSSVQSGISLRIIKDYTLGFAYTKNLIDREELLQNSLDSLKGGVEATFDFPVTKDLREIYTYDPSIENLTPTTIVDECNRVSHYIASRTQGQINMTAGRVVEDVRLLNSSGMDMQFRTSFCFFNPSILYPLSMASVHRAVHSKTFENVANTYLDFLIEIYNRSTKPVNAKGGKIKVLFMPETLYALMWRIQSATNGESIYQKESPLDGRIGQKILDPQLTIYNDPLNDDIPGARAFDDEGTPCCHFPIIEEGILKNFYVDLNHAKKINTHPTGHGFKTARWASEVISLTPRPSLQHLHVKPGKVSLAELIKSIDRGIVVAGALGAHSGNILNGDFSIGLSPGLYVENGEIIGHVKDAMVAGNIYDTMKHIVGIEDTLHETNFGNFPAILFDGVSVATSH